MVSTDQGVCTWYGTDASDFRERFVLSLVIACGKSIGESSSTMSNIFTMTL